MLYFIGFFYYIKKKKYTHTTSTFYCNSVLISNLAFFKPGYAKKNPRLGEQGSHAFLIFPIILWLEFNKYIFFLFPICLFCIPSRLTHPAPSPQCSPYLTLIIISRKVERASRDTVEGCKLFESARELPSSWTPAPPHCTTISILKPNFLKQYFSTNHQPLNCNNVLNAIITKTFQFVVSIHFILCSIRSTVSIHL